MTRRLVLPLMLIVVGIVTLSGCAFIPTFNMTIHDTVNVKKMVGNEKSKKPVRINESSRQDVERLLGPPAAVSNDGRSTIYTWDIRHGTWVMPLCFTILNEDGQGWIEMQYDHDHMLRGVKTTRTKSIWPMAPIFGTRDGRVDPVPYQWQERYPKRDSHYRDQPTTRPTTQTFQ